jgi:hypothetical protein
VAVAATPSPASSTARSCASAGWPNVVTVEDGPDSDGYARRYVDVLERNGATGVRVLKIGGPRNAGGR